MALTHQICHAEQIHQVPNRRPLEGLLALFGEWRSRARGRHELAVLCDRCLRDIGVTRYDADREVRKPFWRA
jgi:uncharacterized protein YjiS (DUF1127 family)